MSIKNLYPTIKPSLLLDFANTEELDPRISFTRTTTARYYDGKTTAKAEENLLQYSQELDQSLTWLRQATVTVDANTGNTTAPDGTSTAESVLETAASGVHSLRQDRTLVAGTHILSVFAKANNRNFIMLANDSVANCNAWFNLSTGAVGTVLAGASNATITSFGNGWYRCSISFTAIAGSNQIRFYLADVDNAATYLGDITKGLYLWGAQLEQRSLVTAYTPTTTQPITNYIPVLQTAAAGQARFDHNPVTGESLGLLIEEQRTNLLTYSAQFDDAAWAKTRISVESNVIIAPDGTLTGDKLIANTDNNTHNLSQTITTTAASHTYSVYCKQGEQSWVNLRINNSGTVVGSFFNLSNGTIGTSGAGITPAISNAGNGWYRCSITLTMIAASNIFFVTSASADSTNSFAGDGYSGIYIWGAQLEAGAFPTSYIPTVAATVTRNADVASMTGTNFSSWYRADEGTLFAEYLRTGLASTTSAMSIDDNTVNNFIRFVSGAGNPAQQRFDITASGASQTSIALTNSGVVGTLYKDTGAYKFNDVATTENAGTVSTDTSVLIPSVTQILIGRNSNNINTSQLNGTIKKIAYYPSRLSDANLQALTT